MMQRFRPLPLAALLALAGSLAIAAPASADNAPIAASKPATVVSGHPCDPNHYYLQCALLTQPQASPNAKLSPTTVFAHGVDFAWTRPSCSTFKANGWTIAATYYSYDSSKGWSRSLADYYRNCGVSMIAYWETTAARATQGYRAGQSDARAALVQMNQAGQQSDRPVFFTVDCDCTGSSIDGYFRGELSIMGYNRSGAYGGYYQMAYLFAHHLIKYGNQTYAWSGGLWGQSCLQQYLNTNSVDYERAVCKDYGQSPYKSPAPAAKCFGKHRHHGPACTNPAAWDKRYNGAIIATRHALTRNHCWVTNAKTPGCKKLRRRGDWFHGRQDRLRAAHIPYPAPWNSPTPRKS